MKPTIETILQNQLNHVHAEVILTAYTESKPGWFESCKEPDFYRFCYIDKGQGWLELNNEKMIIRPGTLYLLPAHTIQSFGTDGNEPFGRYWCHFRLELADIEFMNSLNLPTFVHVQDEQLMRELFTKMIGLHQNTSFTKEMRLKAVLLELIAYYLDESHAQQAPIMDSEHGLKWDEVITYVESNLHTNIQIDDLARFAFLHPNYFITSFRSMMGCSPIQYVTNRRIEKAKQLLVETTLSVSTIAGKVGMQNHYLSRLFKRYTGITPLQYRRISKKGAGLMSDQAEAMKERGNN